MTPSIHKACYCNNIPWDRRHIYFCRAPSYFGVIKANSFACPRNQNQQSRCCPDLFLIPALVGVSLRSVACSRGRTKYWILVLIWISFSVLYNYMAWCYLCANKKRHMFRTRPDLQAPNCQFRLRVRRHCFWKVPALFSSSCQTTAKKVTPDEKPGELSFFLTVESRFYGTLIDDNIVFIIALPSLPYEQLTFS